MRPKRTVTSQFFIGRTYHMNAQGLHNPEITPRGSHADCGDGEFLHVRLGGGNRERLCPKLEGLLGPKSQVINAAVPDIRRCRGSVLSVRYRELEPDIVTILFAFNDHWAAANEIADKDQQMPPRGSSIFRMAWGSFIRTAC